jgi:hypothetical protein
MNPMAGKNLFYTHTHKKKEKKKEEETAANFLKT